MSHLTREKLEALSRCWEQWEAEAATPQRKVARGEARYRDFAVLYRVNAQSQSLEQAFARAAVPYRMLGGLR